MKYKFIGTERTRVFTQWYFPGDIIENSTNPNVQYFKEVNDTKTEKKVKKQTKTKKGDINVMES